MLLCLMLSLQESTVFAQMYGFQGNARIFAESRKKRALGWSRYDGELLSSLLSRLLQNQICFLESMPG